jgi:hypothetical protein
VAETATLTPGLSFRARGRRESAHEIERRVLEVSKRRARNARRALDCERPRAESRPAVVSLAAGLELPGNPPLSSRVRPPTVDRPLATVHSSVRLGCSIEHTRSRRSQIASMGPPAGCDRVIQATRASARSEASCHALAEDGRQEAGGRAGINPPDPELRAPPHFEGNPHGRVVRIPGTPPRHHRFHR